MRLSIYGSCVSRDTVEFCAHPGITLQRYIARQSIIATYGARSGLDLDLGALSSDFQRRMVRGDLDGSLRTVLDEIAADSDLLLWDLTDERKGVYQVAGGAFVTRSVELITSGNDELLATTARHIPLGSDEHFNLWQAALRRFAHSLDKREIRKRVVLIAVPWAEKVDTGAKAPTSQGMSAREANALYARYYDFAEEYVRVERMGQGAPPEAGSLHQWGIAPFHYDLTTYREIAERVGLPISELSLKLSGGQDGSADSS